MNSNLLPCPFCGSTNLRHEFSGSQGYIECNDCGLQGPCDERAADPICDQDAGCAAWNRRAADRAQRQPVPVLPEGAQVIEPSPSFTGTLLVPVAQPVPVSERLPGPEDMTDDGEVWIEDPGHEYPLADAGDYDWEPHKWILRPIGKFDARNGLRWLPAHALPLPREVEA